MILTSLSPFVYFQAAIFLSSAKTTDQVEWNNLVMCPKISNQTIVTGFHLTFNYQDPGNQEDKTIINGIWLGCGVPYQSESQQETKVEWINGAGNNSNPIYGISEQKLFCSGNTVGFRLRVQNLGKLQYAGTDTEDGVINVKIFCKDGEELEGHDERWDYFPGAEYTNKPLKCEEGMAVCGVQTQMNDVELVGGVKTTQLNNLRIHCCPLKSNVTSTISDETTESEYESPFTSSPRHLNVTIFESFDKNFGKNETFTIYSDKCNPIPISWRENLMALEQKSVCIRIWDTEDCQVQGHTRCYCDSDFLGLDDSLKMSRNESWQRNVNALTPCFLEDGKAYTRALIFSEKNYTGKLQGSVILDPNECLSFYEGDKWYNQITSLIVTDGCLEYFVEEECKGNSKTVEGISPRNELGDGWERNIKSLRNCAVKVLVR